MRLIDADKIELFETVNRLITDDYTKGHYDGEAFIMEQIQDAETIDAKPVIHAKWIHTKGNLYQCSACSAYFSYIPEKCNTSKYCPNCGAKMDLQ